MVWDFKFRELVHVVAMGSPARGEEIQEVPRLLTGAAEDLGLSQRGRKNIAS